ncbi:MAG: PIG-L family deacetylase [Ferrovibrio sp.]|uniref:PIG-L deacetylase family protein n=1 Tax=Ferrovibrio sp. TaxID=1917215 RepID=UPI0026092569|nr:PIG-L deacetylase family protein [Ferrovibrio sp.]MCW0234947.1 PIG-L family deacetylase [Ferrovibrio sp.]
MNRILVVAAHPDDEVLGCGGMIAAARDKKRDVRVIFLAEGVMSRYSADQINSPAALEASRLRNANAFKALDILGVPADQVFVSERPCCRLDQASLLALTQEIEAHLKDFRASVVYTHAQNDPNIDHQIAFKAVLPAVRPLGPQSPKAVYSFEVLSSTEWNPAHPFQANCFVDISSSIDRKISALAAYGDEMRPAPHPRSEDMVRSLARFRGAQSGLNYAESFNLIRAIES